MNKKTIRAFAIGILFSASLIGSFYFLTGSKNKPSLEEIKKQIEDAGFVVLSEEEYKQLLFNNSENNK